ncbi:hypothetical protein Tco_0630943 [Tanacetum coccineum]
MPSSLSPEPTFGYIDDLDFFKDFENEFPTIAYNDLKSKSDPLIEPSVNMAPLPHCDLRHLWLRLTDGMRQTLGDRLSIVYIRDDGQEDDDLSNFILALVLHSDEEMQEAGFGAHIRSGQYLFRHTEGRKSGARLSRGHFIGHLAAHFSLISDEGLRGLSIIARELPVIDLHELARLNICSRFGDTWAWEAQGLELQQGATIGAPGATEDPSIADEGTQAVPKPVQAPQPPPPAPQHRTMSQRIECCGLTSSITDQTRVSTWMINCMTHLMDASGRTY